MFMKFELHCHSFYSKGEKIPCEGLNSPKQIIRRAKNIGLDGIALTDHKVITGLKQAEKEAKKQRIIFIPGIELQTKAGHLIGLGVNEKIKNFLSLDETIDKIHEQGAITIAPHPFDIKGDGIRDEISKVDIVEVFNALNIDKLSNYLTEKKVNNKPVVVGTDAHSLEMIGYCLNLINANDMDSVLKQIKKKKVKFEKNYIPLNVIIDWSRERLIRSNIDVLNYINENYWFPKNRIAKTLLNKFIESESKIWGILATFSLNLSRIYGTFRLMPYF